MSHRFGWVAAIVVAVIALLVGAVGYNIGVSHGLAMATLATGGSGAAVPYMWYRPWGFGAGFGPLFFVLLLNASGAIFAQPFGRGKITNQAVPDSPPSTPRWRRRSVRPQARPRARRRCAPDRHRGRA